MGSMLQTILFFLIYVIDMASNATSTEPTGESRQVRRKVAPPIFSSFLLAAVVVAAMQFCRKKKKHEEKPKNREVEAELTQKIQLEMTKAAQQHASMIEVMQQQMERQELRMNKLMTHVGKLTNIIKETHLAS